MMLTLTILQRCAYTHSVEYVASGTGIGNTYEFLAHKHPDKVDPAIHAEIQAAGSNRARVITDPAHTTVSDSVLLAFLQCCCVSVLS
jgi:glucokinase